MGSAGILAGIFFEEQLRRRFHESPDLFTTRDDLGRVDQRTQVPVVAEVDPDGDRDLEIAVGPDPGSPVMVVSRTGREAADAESTNLYSV